MPPRLLLTAGLIALPLIALIFLSLFYAYAGPRAVRLLGVCIFANLVFFVLPIAIPALIAAGITYSFPRLGIPPLVPLAAAALLILCVLSFAGYTGEYREEFAVERLAWRIEKHPRAARATLPEIAALQRIADTSLDYECKLNVCIRLNQLGIPTPRPPRPEDAVSTRLP